MSAATLDRAGGEVIARGEDYRQTFQHFRPGFDLAAERLRREKQTSPSTSMRVTCTRTLARA
jgi:hypothetical protein